MENRDFTVTIRLMNEQDTSSVAEIEKKVFSQPWSEKAFRDTVNDGNYIYIVAEHNARIVGYAGCIVSVDEADIANIAVDEDYRRLGIANQLLRQCFILLKRRNSRTVYLEVRESNVGAQSLYKHNGFTAIGMRRNFYQKPVEDAIIMVKNLQ